MSNNPQTDLSDRIAEALMRWAEGNNDPQYARMRRSETVRANAYSRADVVLAVLPAVPVPPTTHATVLTDTDRQFLTFALDLAADQMASRGDEFDGDDEAAMEKLRRMADEAQQQKPGRSDVGTEFVRHTDHLDGEALARVEAELEQSGVDTPGCAGSREEAATTSSAHQPRRDDEFDRWLKAQRDIYKRGRLEWYALDCVIDLYRLHADTGTPLGERACECRATEDCACLEDSTGGTP